MRVQTVELATRNRLAADQLAAAIEVHLGKAEVGQGGTEQGGLDIAVQLQQRLALADLLPGLELQGFHRTVGFQPQVDALQGRETADCRQAILPGALAGLGCGHGNRWLGGREHLDLLIDGERLVAPQNQHEQQNNT
ncbi:hypothetical protein D3C80_1301990 [compost metagenome]